MKSTVFSCACFLISAVVGVLTTTPSVIHAADPARIAESELDLFDAREKGQLAVRFVPASERKGALTLSNRTRTPLAIRVPDTLGAVPVLAQFQPPAQIIGLGVPGARNNQVFRAAALKAERPVRVVQLPPRAEISIALKGVCLEYGKRTPNSRMRYDLVPVQQVATDARLVAALQSLADESYDQQAVQAVAWHLANGLTWKSLRGKFSAREYQGGQQLLREISTPKEAPVTPAPGSKESPHKSA
ncbi:MAG: hypothetical protein K8T91_22265 [Planctomycetes bacterium]|nr:hypothetical protein [Planctomycetota bacterium]